MSASCSRRLSGSGKTKERWALHAMPVLSPSSCCNWPAVGRTTDSDLQAHHSAWTTGFFPGNWWRLVHTSPKAAAFTIRSATSRTVSFTAGTTPGPARATPPPKLDWFLGFPDKAAAAAREAVALADRIAHPLTREIGLEYAAHVHLHRREPEAALAYIAAVENLRAEQRVSYIIEPEILRAAAKLAQGAIDDATALLREVFAPGKARTTAWQPYGHAIFAEVLMRRGAYAEAAASLRQGFDRIAATGERVWEAELHRLNGRVLLARNELDAAQESLLRAIRTAQEQKAKSLELRTATDLARLWGDQGRRAEARELLTSVHDWFTEGFDTADLKEAKALVDELT